MVQQTRTFSTSNQNYLLLALCIPLIPAPSLPVVVFVCFSAFYSAWLIVDLIYRGVSPQML